MGVIGTILELLEIKGGPVYFFKFYHSPIDTLSLILDHENLSPTIQVLCLLFSPELKLLEEMQKNLTLHGTPQF
jgi:hypothetical protein